jgi:hypothetical protein
MCATSNHQYNAPGHPTISIQVTFLLATLSMLLVVLAASTSRERIMSVILDFALLSWGFSVLWGLLLRRFSAQRKLWLVLFLSPACYVSAFLVWDVMNRPVTDFKTYIQNPIPQSVQNLHGYRKAVLKGYSACMTFNIHPDEVKTILRPAYKPITSTDSAFSKRLIHDVMTCHEDKFLATFPPPEAFEFYYDFKALNGAVGHYVMALHKNHAFVLFEYRESND